MSTMEKLIFFLFHGERMPALLEVSEYQFFCRWVFFYWVRDFLFIYVYFFLKVERQGKRPWGQTWNGQGSPSSMPGPMEMRLPTIVYYLSKKRLPWAWPKLGRFSGRC